MKEAHHPDNAQKAEEQLYLAISLLKDPEEIKAFFLDLCTPAEIQAMADRWQVIDFIQAGKPYREIYELTKVSVTTVGRVARCLRYGTGGYKKVYERLSKLRNTSK